MLDQVDRGVAVAVDYRLASRADDGTVTDAFPASVEDVDRAVRFVRADAGALGVDPDRIVLAGASAGGHLALLAAAAPGRYTAADLPADLQSVSPDVQGVMAFVAPTDLVTFVDEDNEMAEASLTTFLACPTTESTSCDTALAAEASPATHLGAGAPPAYLVYGANDTLAPAATQGVPIALRWAAARGDTLGVGSAVQLHVVDAGHNLDRDHVDLAALEEWLDAVVR
ncbi:MAG: alpha/beta hydrolase [Acidimicrobiia bacterium]